VLWFQKIGGAIGGGILTCRAGGAQRIAVATGMISPIWPTEKCTAKVVVLGLPGPESSASYFPAQK
jgi:alcohol dehydrogenase (cytochrome c)